MSEEHIGRKALMKLLDKYVKKYFPTNLVLTTQGHLEEGLVITIYSNILKNTLLHLDCHPL